MKPLLFASTLLVASLTLTYESQAACSCVIGTFEQCANSGCAMVTDGEGNTITSYVRRNTVGAWIACQTTLLTYWNFQPECKEKKEVSSQ